MRSPNPSLLPASFWRWSWRFMGFKQIHQIGFQRKGHILQFGVGHAFAREYDGMIRVWGPKPGSKRQGPAEHPDYQILKVDRGREEAGKFVDALEGRIRCRIRCTVCDLDFDFRIPAFPSEGRGHSIQHLRNSKVLRLRQGVPRGSPNVVFAIALIFHLSSPPLRAGRP